MSYLLDTNACVSHLRFPEGTRVSRRLADMNPSDVVLYSVVKAELIYGAMRSRNAERNVTQLERFFLQFVSLPFDDRAANMYGQIRSQLASQGTPIGPNDLMIAAIALANDTTLVPHNSGEFGRVAGLKIEDWDAQS